MGKRARKTPQRSKRGIRSKCTLHHQFCHYNLLSVLHTIFILFFFFAAIRCSTFLPLPLNTKRRPPKSTVEYGQIVTYTCEQGFSFNVADRTDNVRSTRCSVNGLFTPSYLPACHRKVAYKLFYKAKGLWQNQTVPNICGANRACVERSLLQCLRNKG